jgi:hypothetical protein
MAFPQNSQPQSCHCLSHTLHYPIIENNNLSFATTTKANNIKIGHQSLCNPPFASSLKAINVGFLKGALHLDAHTVCKYLMPSQATTKCHMK